MENGEASRSPLSGSREREGVKGRSYQSAADKPLCFLSLTWQLAPALCPNLLNYARRVLVPVETSRLVKHANRREKNKMQENKIIFYIKT